VESHNNDPETVFGAVVSLILIPANAAPLPFKLIKLLSTLSVVVLTFVVVPCTAKLPFMVTFEPVNSNALLKELLKEFKLLVNT